MKYRHPLRFFARTFAQNAKPKICVVGSGPAGFYTAQHLLKKLNSPEIDIFERYPVPFGLVRFGVAPDHPEVKNVEHTFTKVAENPNVRFLGNVTVGRDVSLNQLKEAYHAVILAYGAESNRKLNIPGEDLKNVLPARRIVGWYNGIPEDKNLDIDLSGETVAIFGQGNVAIDVARILLSPIDVLKKTDITAHALDKLAESKVKTVYLIGRRGPLQAAYTIKELREMLKLENCSTEWREDDFVGVAEAVPSLARPKKRIAELMLKSLTEKNRGEKKFKPIFYRSPVEILGQGGVEGVKLGINRLAGSGDILTKTAVPTGEFEHLNCQLAITSIGYSSFALEGINFDVDRGVIWNELGRMETGLYAVGWVATGPTGVILTTMGNGFGTAETITKDLGDVVLIPKPGYELVEKVLKDNNVNVVSWDKWLKIDQFEVARGGKSGKPREKLIDLNKMLEVAFS